ncbi:MAG TPA: calcium-binding protein [Tepidisphaeraceae bacterium]|nr:calcium-binding protein [Tepidisphaeraceae bacterium]
MRQSQRGIRADAISPVIETLEDRRMLSASLVHGILKITGTTAADAITVGLDPANKAKILVKMGAKNSRFTKTAVKTISILSGDGADTITISSGIKQQITIKSGEGDDTVHGAGGREVVFAGGGADQVFGGNGSDQVFGGEGDDQIDGGAGNDYLYGDGGNDTVSGGVGNDVLAGDSEDTLVFSGQPPFDIIGNDSLNGGDGNDWLLGGARVETDPVSHNLFLTGNGQDTFTGGAGADIIDKGGSDDTITDLAGEDYVPVDEAPSAHEGGQGDVHTHVILKIRVRSGSRYKNVVVQPNIGRFGSVDFRFLHTHDTSGRIHFEAGPPNTSYRLIDFFRLWGISLDSQHVGRFIPPAGKKVTMWVTRNGATTQSTKFGSFVPKGGGGTADGDVIEIRVG